MAKQQTNSRQQKIFRKTIWSTVQGDGSTGKSFTVPFGETFTNVIGCGATIHNYKPSSAQTNIYDNGGGFAFEYLSVQSVTNSQATLFIRSPSGATLASNIFWSFTFWVEGTL